MSANSEKCPSQFPRPKGVMSKVVGLSNEQLKPKDIQFAIIQNKEKQLGSHFGKWKASFGFSVLKKLFKRQVKYQYHQLMD